MLRTAAILLLTAASAAAQSRGRTAVPDAVRDRLASFEDVTYARYGDRTLQLDLYRPAGDAKLPAVVCLHGGGWWRGERQSMTNLAMALADRGYVTATITYRLSGEAPFPAAVHDGKAAVRFLRANADQYGIDPNRIGVTGLSAGGHLAALLATSGGVAELEGDGGHAGFSSAVQAAVPMGAQSNFRRHHANVQKSDPDPPGEKPNLWVQFLGGKPGERPEAWRLASPITHLAAGDPPTRFLSGDKDSPTTHAEEFRAKAAEAGVASDYRPIPNAPHAFLGGQRAFNIAVDHTADWFDRHLKGQTAD